MCDFIKGKSVAPGWGCCACKTYNGLQRRNCRMCNAPRHEPLSITGVCSVGKYYEDSMVVQVDILAVESGDKMFGIKFKSRGGDIVAGRVWTSQSAYDYYPQLWRIE